jgi:hypothetical protein
MQTSHHDLDALAGSWTRRERFEFDRALAEQRIDEDLWNVPQLSELP